MQNFLIAERKQELADEGKPDAAQQSMDAELQRLEDVSYVDCACLNHRTAR